MRQHPREWCLGGIFLLTLVLFGGGTTVWCQAMVLAFVGLMLWLSPPVYRLGPWIDYPVLVFVGLAFASFLPIGGLGRPDWWIAANEYFGIDLPFTVTVQPLVTLESIICLLCVIAWLYMVCNWGLAYTLRKRVLWGIAFSTAILAVGVVLGAINSWKYPFGLEAQSFSYFPNRNQTATLLAMGGVIGFSMMVESLRRYKWMAVLGILTTLANFGGLSYSLGRAGMLLFFIGLFLWGCWYTIRQSGHKHHSIGRRLWMLRVGIPVILIFVSLFIILGGQSFERIQLMLSTVEADRPEFRLLIYKDSLQMIMDHPVMGVGLGNFPFVYPQYINHSVTFLGFLHPDSDWFWLFAEMGVTGGVVVLIGIIGLLRACWFREESHSNVYRGIAIVAVVLFLIHSIVDVPGHRLGTIMVVLYVYALGRSEVRFGRAKRVSKIFCRCLGTVFILVGTVWGAGWLFERPFHSELIQRFSDKKIEEAIELENAEKVELIAESSLSKLPLAWRFYFNRARSKLYLQRDGEAAMADFRRARFLETKSAHLPFLEGLAWLPFSKAHTLAAWREVIDRVARKKDEIYRRMILEGQKDPEIWEGVAQMAKLDSELQKIFLLSRRGSDLLNAFIWEIGEDPVFSKYSIEDAQRIFSQVAREGGAVEILRHFDRFSVLKERFWFEYAQALAAMGSFKEACDLASERIEKPVQHDYTQNRERSAIEEAYILTGKDYVQGLALSQKLIELNLLDEALQVTEELLVGKKVPTVIYYWRAIVLLEKERFEDSWKAWVRYAESLE